MNCAECRDKFAAFSEGLLERWEEQLCQGHLEACAGCRAEYEAVKVLQQQLVERGRSAEGVEIVEQVMRRTVHGRKQIERETFMSRLLRHGWGYGVGVAAVAAAVMFIVMVMTPKAQARAEDVMARGARAVAKLTSIHLKGQLRTLPGDNFSYIDAKCPFCSIELWKEFEPELKWRVEKPDRVIVMDGQTTVMISGKSIGVKLPQRTESAFDTDWLHRIANLSITITNELVNAAAKGWKLNLEQVTGADGRSKSVVTVLAKSGLPDSDYLKNSFFNNADSRRVYHFDNTSELLEAVEVYLVRTNTEVQIFNLSQIDYNQQLGDTVWQLDVPTNVDWALLPEQIAKLPDNDKYTSMTAEQAARAFFEACSRRDWDEAAKFVSPLTASVKDSYGGLELVSIGDAFTSKAYGDNGRFVPYEVKMRQQFNMRVVNTNAAKRYVVTGLYDTQLKLQQDLQWTNEPAILPNNAEYAAMSPSEVVKAYFEAQSRFDWTEMGKFTSQYDVDTTKQQIETALQQPGMDTNKLVAQLPKFEVGEGFWSADQSAWFVKCSMANTKKWNLALRKDNAAGRWQLDGGF